MLFGPIFSVDMVTTVRRQRHYIIRAVYALALLMLLYISFYEASGRDSYTIHEMSATAQQFFSAFSFLQLLAVLILGPALSAGTVALERERRTIEYLFATDLSNAEIVLGRLAARMLMIGSDILVGLPILAVAMLFGGIAFDQLLAVFALTFSTALFVVSLSIAISVATPRARDAVIRSYVILLAIFVVPAILSAGFSILGLPGWLSELINLAWMLNPFWPLSTTLYSTMPTWSLFSQVLIGQSVVAFICIILAILRIRKVHLHSASGTQKWLPFRELRLFKRRRREPSDRPMLWKEMFATHAAIRLGTVGRICVLLLICCALGVSVTAFFSALESGQTYTTPAREYAENTLPIVGFIASFGGLAIAARAASSISSEKERQCWDSLISSPLEAREIVGGKIWGNVYAARGLVVLLIIFWGLGVLLNPSYIVMLGFCLITQLIVLLFVSALGVFYSLWCTSSLRAIGSTLGTLLFVGGGYLFCCLPLFMADPGDGAYLIMAPFIPFLQVFPMIAAIEPGPPGNDELSWMLVAYLVGNAGYFSVTWILYEASIRAVRPDFGFEDGVEPIPLHLLKSSRAAAIVTPEVVNEFPPDTQTTL